MVEAIWYEIDNWLMAENAQSLGNGTTAGRQTRLQGLWDYPNGHSRQRQGIDANSLQQLRRLS
ncbi:hypothetical protein, partial [Mesorhizobium sp. M7A.F.Ca.ET.027.03.2.1]|uniref:hypothetical protein n=1 Tax=Mesorhizobium sp. M7A.F.Ca.ET.027.03.2.1 TaxID=2496656 RepID=UPI001AECA666